MGGGSVGGPLVTAAALGALTAVRLAERALLDDAHRLRRLAAQRAGA
ncbi:hypothetical protein [Streptomyces sp. NPDC004296]